METTSTALYRTYRPGTFADVRGQEPIVTALEGAVKSEKIPHALLFVGSRGTGKTSIARIFAAVIGASPLDTYEIDAASNRGIDDIRELREAVHTLPYESPRKVYIIDEVHMLTKEAFSALLKTLEEPPEHVVFILATTEPDKLLDTITSRCQVFRFKTPSRALLVETVTDVAKQEKFTLPKDAAELVALSADGSFRDALGTLQKVIMASNDQKANADEVAAIIGAPKGALVMDLVRALVAKDAGKGLAAIEAAAGEHVDMELFVRLLLERIRAVLLARHGSKEEALARVAQDEREELAALASDARGPVNSALLDRLLKAAEQTGRTYVAQLPLELAVIELCGEVERAG